MRKLLLFAMFLGASMYLNAQQAEVSGTVFDSESGKTIPGTSVYIGSDSALTYTDGYYELNGIPVGKASITFKIKGYEMQTMSINVTAPATKLSAIGLKPLSLNNPDNNGISEVNLSALDFEDENKGQNITGLLHSTSDVFINSAGFTLSAANFRIRGYESENSTVYMSNIQVNDPENGRPSCPMGGLNDAMQNKDVVNGLGAAMFSFGAVGGATNVITRASMQRKQNKLSYSLSNKSYINRLMYTYSTGLMKTTGHLHSMYPCRLKPIQMYGDTYDKFLSAISVKNVDYNGKLCSRYFL